MQTFEVEIKGKTALMQHRMPRETLMGLLGTKAEKKKIKEVLTPRQIAEKHVYKDKKGNFVIPLEYVRQAWKAASSEYKQKHSSRKSYKTIAAAIFRPNEEFATIYLDQKFKPVKNFEVDIRAANNALKGAVAVCRPRFDRWYCKFTVSVDTDLIDEATCIQVLEDSGHKVGIGSYRICKGGQFGEFSVVKFKRLKAALA